MKTRLEYTVDVLNAVVAIPDGMRSEVLLDVARVTRTTVETGLREAVARTLTGRPKAVSARLAEACALNPGASVGELAAAVYGEDTVKRRRQIRVMRWQIKNKDGRKLLKVVAS